MPTNSRSEARHWSAKATAGAALAFAVLATLNAGGYRYGTSDQAFYIPAILHHLDSGLFPGDWPMLGAQARYFLVDEMFAVLVRATGWSLATWFALAQASTLALLFAGALHLGRQVLTSTWALTAWLAALTLKHRITKTGVNTLEGYFHPRMLVFALGLLALGDALRGRRWRPLALAAVATAIHPSTAVLFLVLVVATIVVETPSWRRPVTGVMALGGLGLVAALAFGRGPDLAPMDAGWRALVATKDYTFPTTWSASTWLLNLSAPAVLVVAAWKRHLDQPLARREVGLILGALVLVGGFLVSLPFIDRGVPLAVQLQTSRAFWPVEALAVLWLVWWLVDQPLQQRTRLTAARAVAVFILGVSVARGLYVGFIEHPDRPLVAVDLVDDDWTRALAWVRRETTDDTFVVADPAHAWAPDMGTAVRIGAWRDVVLEETKDVAMAMYSRDAAHRVVEKIHATQDFARLSADALRALAPANRAAVLVVSRALEFPVRFRSGSVTVYALTP